MQDTFKLGNHTFSSRFILGSGKFSLDIINAAVQEAGAQIITLALRRANIGGIANILDYIPKGVTILPNTSGARNAEEALRIARLARECGCGDFIKVEVIHESKYLFRFWLMKSICPLLSTPVSADHPKPAKQWKWA